MLALLASAWDIVERVWGVEIEVQSLGFRVWCVGIEVCCGVLGLRFKVEGVESWDWIWGSRA